MVHALRKYNTREGKKRHIVMILAEYCHFSRITLARIIKGDRQ